MCGSQWDRTLSYKVRWFGTADQYAQRFEKEYRYEAPYQAAGSPAAVLAFADAFERAGSFDTEKVGYVLVAGQLAMAGTGSELGRDPEVGRLFLGT
ncbi:hypothetical protein [Cupriavidus necator]